MMLLREQGVGITQAEFRHVLGHFASGVTVVTTTLDDHCYGITVSSFCSLSLEPPLVLICIDRRLNSHDVIAKAGWFGVNILAEDGAALSQHFASRLPDKFATVAHHRGETGMPLLDDALATIECRLVNALPGGDHSIFVGEVVATTTHPDAKPLLYYRSDYHKLG
jgi:flavin reductase (DIM6/NTAB) family NADH-FMN oxidoreductase RutF